MVFPDISEETRTVGRVEIFQIFSGDTTQWRSPAIVLGGNVILAEPPADPNISITLLTLKNFPICYPCRYCAAHESWHVAGQRVGELSVGRPLHHHA